MSTTNTTDTDKYITFSNGNALGIFHGIKAMADNYGEFDNNYPVWTVIESDDHGDDTLDFETAAEAVAWFDKRKASMANLAGMQQRAEEMMGA